MGLFQKLFGTYSSRQLKKNRATVDAIERLEPHFSKMTDEEMRSTTDQLKLRYSAGESLDALLPEAFALVREADKRVLGKRPFRVQLEGGIVLHQGRIAEMKTGEGKTLVATLPAFLNALTGKGVHIVTVNEYLARMGYEEMGRVYEFLGLTCGLILQSQTAEEKRAAYQADITYCTNSELGFDYLRDNMVQYQSQKVQRGHVFAIVDEMDSILIDEARTPLIISGEGEESTELYSKADKLARSLRVQRVQELDTKKVNDEYDADYLVDEKARHAVLTIHGVKKAESFFGIENLSDPENAVIAHHVNLAIRAHGVMFRDNEYVVTEDGKIMIVDPFTGRIMPGRRYSDGLHQAIEAKEHVDVQKENRTVASITYQNLFRLYNKLSGMTGTAQTEEVEFREIYNLDVVVIPTNKTMIRVDHVDKMFKTEQAKYKAVIAQIRACHEKGQPILVGTASVERSEALSKLLKREKIPHTVLNAKFHAKEAEIVANAGTRFEKDGKMVGTVTIATNMAGRGTDIMLGGNPEFLAKKDMEAEGYSDEMIAQAVSSARSEDSEVLAAREVYKALFEKHKEAIAPEAEAICAAGGLFILGTERHESRRIDNQLRGRAGRQGDPGESCFYISLEDDLLRRFGDSGMLSMALRSLSNNMDEEKSLDLRLLATFVERAQRAVEGRNFSSRKHVLSYDDVLSQQRKLIYKQRDEVLEESDLTEKIGKMTHFFIEEVVAKHTMDEDASNWNLLALQSEIPFPLAEGDLVYSEEALAGLKRKDLAKLLCERADAHRAKLRAEYGEELMGAVERKVLLRQVDLKWMEHLETMEDLRDTVQLQVYAQRNPLSEYRLQGSQIFDGMIDEIREETAREVLAIRAIDRGDADRHAVVHIVGAGFEGDEADQKRKNKKKKRRSAAAGQVQTVHKEKTPEPNDPCPCGSGKKYKKCCALRKSSTTGERAE